MPVFKDKLTFYKGGKGFFHARWLSADGVEDEDHHKAAKETYDFALECAKSSDYQLVVCDEICNAVYHNLLTEKQLETLIDESRKTKTNLCLTGRNFPAALLEKVDIATDMGKLKHHYDDKFLANQGIDY